MRGFFAGSTLISTKAPVSLLPKCGACGLHKGCSTPKMKVGGDGRKRILIVGEFPDIVDDERGYQFEGDSGKYLSDAMFQTGVDLHKDCWLTNALICYPGGRVKDKRAVEYCRPNLLQTIEDLNPISIVLLGSLAVQSYIGHVWKASPGSITRWNGYSIPCQKPNVWITCLPSPEDMRREYNKTAHRRFEAVLARACSYIKPPWDVVPNYEAQIDVMFDTSAAAAVLRKMAQRGGAIAFDYENNCLRPETPGGEIVCASACWRGKKTISYPWHGDAIEATWELLHSDNCHFIASNLKHEERWTRKKSGKGVRHWLWDTMLAAHVIDNRREICGLKFQAFALLGAEAYDEHIKQFLEEKGDGLNRVKDEVDMRQLLTYCGTDTLLEYLLAEKQMQSMGLDPTPITYINESSMHNAA